MRVDAAHVEADGAMVLVPVDGPDDVDEGKLDHAAHGVVDECALALGDGLVADLVHEVVQRDARGVDARGVLRAGLELLRHGGPGGSLLGDGVDHLAAGVDRVGAIEQVHATP